jgi:tRNA U34 5-carboxymethylaminomethyl modifying GTPase MnmE/TrmE
MSNHVCNTHSSGIAKSWPMRRKVDEVLAVLMRGPHSYTREDVVSPPGGNYCRHFGIVVNEGTVEYSL